MVERHPLSSQAFVPLSRLPFLVVVARPGDVPRADDLRAFVTNGRQGVNYARGTWHHPLIAFDESGDFLVIDRGGPGADCDEVHFDDREIVLDAPAA
jgi:ureidoglycolate lyase